MLNRVNNVIIIGGMKCGTTSMRALLHKSGVHFGPREEHYFNDRSKMEKYKHYSLYLEAKYGKCHADIIGDDTPSYSYLPQIPQLIKNDAPDSKLIFIVRDPVKRAISNYWHAVRRGAETREINSAFEENLAGNSPNIWLDYVERSRYSKQYRNFLKFFNEDDIFVTSLERMMHNFSSEKRNIEKFLDIRIECDTFPSENNRSFHARPYINKLLPSTINQSYIGKGAAIVVRHLFSYKTSIPRLNEDLSERLKDRFTDEYKFINDRLEKRHWYE